MFAALEFKQKQKKKEKKTEFLDLLDFKNEVCRTVLSPSRTVSHVRSDRRDHEDAAKLLVLMNPP